MADKDEFKFDDDDTFPETDLSGAFSEGEQAAPEEPEYPMTIKKAGGSKTRLLLLVLLLAIAGGGGYYFFMMEEPAPPPPPKKVVAAASKPAPQPAPAVAPAPAAAPAAGPAQVSVPPPAKPAPQPAPAVAPAPAPGAVSVPPPPAPKPAAAPAPTPAPAKPAAPAVVAVPAPAPAKPAAVAAPVPAKPEARPAAAGPWLVEAGTYLNASALKTAEKKVRALGYEPQISTTRKSVRMTRLRLGTYPETDAKQALAYARGIAPDAFMLRSGDGFTVYAGTFASPENLRLMSERLTSEGVKVEEEPLEVTKTLSLVRFGGFADQATAAEAAAKARRAGIAAEVVKPR